MMVQAANFAKIIKHKIYSENNFLHLETTAAILLSSEMKEAIKHNIPLTFVWKIKFEKKRSWYVWDKELYDRKLSRKLYFNQALRRYVIEENTAKRKVIYYKSLDDAIKAMAKLKIAGFLSTKKLRTGALYTSSVRFEFKVRSLPAMMIPRGVWSKNWKFDTGWNIKRFNI